MAASPFFRHRQEQFQQEVKPVFFPMGQKEATIASLFCTFSPMADHTSPTPKSHDPHQLTLEDNLPPSSITTTSTMGDPVRLSQQKCREAYEDGFKTWSALWAATGHDPALPTAYLSAHTAFRHLPALPRGLRLKSDKHTIYANGLSSWGSTTLGCQHGLTRLSRRAQFVLGTRHPVAKRLIIAESPDDAFN